MTSVKVDIHQMEIKEENVIFGHKICQTKEAKWLRLDDIYQKFYRPHPYDAGGTYDGNAREYWFYYRTEQVGSHFLLHLYMCNALQNAVDIALSHNSELITGKCETETAFLSPYLKLYELTEMENYITTYHFTQQDIETLIDKKLYIPIRINRTKEKVNTEIKAKHDFGDLITDPIGADFTIETMDGEKFKFHKTVLTVQSEVFNAMLKGETSENQNNYVLLNDVGKEDLQCIQQYVYTGAVTHQANWENLLVLADRYDLSGLQQLAERWLAEEITLDNAVELLVIGDTYNSDFLKQQALKFIKRHPFVLRSAEFKEVQNVGLLRELTLSLAIS